MGTSQGGIALAAWQRWDGAFCRTDALVLLGVFDGLMDWPIREGLHFKDDHLGIEMEQELELALEQMPHSTVTPVHTLNTAPVKLSPTPWQIAFQRLNQKMIVILHQAIGITDPAK
ncbi:MAG: hypothetical protein WD425_08305 [Nitrospirales bacterium]